MLSQGPKVRRDRPSQDLVATFGYNDRARGKSLYFLRTGGPVRLDVAADETLLAGEVGGAVTLLDSLTFLVSNIFHPKLMGQRDWGVAPRPTVDEFVADVGRFAVSVDESVKGMGGGGAVVLARVDPRIDIDAVNQAAMVGPIDYEIAKQFEGRNALCFVAAAMTPATATLSGQTHHIVSPLPPPCLRPLSSCARVCNGVTRAGPD